MNAAPKLPVPCRASWRRALLLPTLACVLTACGGGGNGGGVEEAVAEPLLEAPGRATVQQTDRELDLAIFGDGMFPFIDAQGRTVYSRTARLGLDEQNHLINADGAWLAGEPDGTTKAGEPQALAAVPMTLPQQATRKVRIEVNLEACTPRPYVMWNRPLQRVCTPDGGFCAAPQPLDPGAMTICPAVSTLPTPASWHSDRLGLLQTIYDAQGLARLLFVSFLDTGGSVWQVFATVDGEPVGSPDRNTPLIGLLRFDPTNGTLDPATARWTAAIPPNPADPAGAPELVEFDLSGSTQFASLYRVSYSAQDGYPAGELQQIVVDGDDVIRLRYSNGQERNHGRVLLAQFSVADRMRAVGESGWLCEQQCAGPRFAAPTTQLTGQVRSGYLEPTLR